MRTFDLANIYLQDFDFKIFPVSLSLSEKKDLIDSTEVKELRSILERYLLDKRNDKSNDYYKSSIFEFAIYHNVFIAHGLVSPFDVATAIVNEYEPILKGDYERFNKTIYPKLMVDEWDKYCEELKKKTSFIEGELRTELFFAAFHYVTQPLSA